MIYFIVIGLVVFLTVGYFVLMFLYPEWVGISGEDTKKAIESHRGDASSQPTSQTDSTDPEDSTPSS